MIRLANQSYLVNIVGLAIGDKLAIDYQLGEIRIKKINNSNLCLNKS